MKVIVHPYRHREHSGNIMWDCGAWPMRGGRFPVGHPIGGGVDADHSMQFGGGKKMEAFRARGYWASCFPEGDGITWKPERGQSDEQAIQDIRECFGWDAEWHPMFVKSVAQEGKGNE